MWAPARIAERHDARRHRNVAETQSFRELLAKSGFYKEWREKLGDEAWTLLEKQVGKLG